jgi:hypothetical protein
MENINFSDINTDDEKVKLFNQIIDNQNRIEGKVLQIIADRASDDAYNAEVDDYNKSLSKPKKKGGK